VIGARIGPLTRRLDEALGFAICLRPVRLGEDALKAELPAHPDEGFGTIAEPLSVMMRVTFMRAAIVSEASSRKAMALSFF